MLQVSGHVALLLFCDKRAGETDRQKKKHSPDISAIFWK
jgi:hypothetical protein